MGRDIGIADARSKASREAAGMKMLSIDLCAGAGGLALATTQAGFKPVALLEKDPIACKTISENRRRGGEWVKDWPDVEPTDLTEFDYAKITEPIDLISGGPPCQPYSVAGKRRGAGDGRDLFGEVARAMRELRPRAVFIENTNGLAGASFFKHHVFITNQLGMPGVERNNGETWRQHALRLDRLFSSKRIKLRYAVRDEVLNAADFGLAQCRKRMFFVAFRDDCNPTDFIFPKETHSLEALLRDQWVTGEYWSRHEIAKKNRPDVPAQFKARVERLKKSNATDGKLPWVTVRDTLASLPAPSAKIPNHEIRPGARPYAGHTGSALDFPAKVLKAGRHGVPGGENMLRELDGSVRYFTIRECARLQSFPDDYYFKGGWRTLTRQVGNAVPVLVCRRVAETIRGQLEVLDLKKAGAALS